MKLPSTAIVIAHRSDSSGTTPNFSQFLVEGATGVWKLGTSSTINWPATSRGGNGNGGVAQIVKSTAGAIGYVDYADAKASGLTWASIKNKDGDYVEPSVQAATQAASNASVKPDLTFSAIWAPGAGSYPITAQSWVLLYQKQSSSNVTKMLKAYVGYLVGDGQKLLPGLGYAQLPSSIDQKAKAQISKIGSYPVTTLTQRTDPATPAGSARAPATGCWPASSACRSPGPCARSCPGVMRNDG